MVLGRVGDSVTYEGDSEAAIIDDAGSAAVWGNKPFALVSFRLSNGDRTKETLQDFWDVTVRADKPILGLFDPAYVPASAESSDAEGNAHA